MAKPWSLLFFVGVIIIGSCVAATAPACMRTGVVFYAFFMRSKRARARDTRTIGEGPTSLHDRRFMSQAGRTRCLALRAKYRVRPAWLIKRLSCRLRPYPRPTRPLRVSLARKTRENRTVISVFFFVPLSVFYSLKETSYCLSTGCLVKNCSTCNDGFVRITYSLARRRLQANRNFTVCKPCNQTEKGRMKAKMQVIDRDESKCPPGQKEHSFFRYGI